MSNSNPIISIIIPVYNTEKYLRRCLDSIVVQTYKDFECILVDDGSSDGSGKICDEYAEKDNRFKVFHKKNGGVSSARNAGLDKANGRYIAFCDSDDSVEPNWLSEFVTNMVNVDITVSSFTYVHEDGKKHPSIYDFKTDDVPLGWTLIQVLGEGGMLWNKCFRAEIIRENNIKFNEKYILFEDEEFVSHYLMFAKRIRFSSNPTYNYSTSSNWGKKYVGAGVIDCLLDSCEHMSSFVPKSPLYAQSYDSILQRAINSLADVYEARQYESGLQYLKRICKILQENPGIKLTFNRLTRLLWPENPIRSHKIFKMLAKINKLRCE